MAASCSAATLAGLIVFEPGASVMGVAPAWVGETTGVVIPAILERDRPTP